MSSHAGMCGVKFGEPRLQVGVPIGANGEA